MLSGILGRETYEQVLFREHVVPLWIYDPRTLAFLDVNEAAMLLYGYSKIEFLAATVDKLRPLDGLPLATAGPSPSVLRHRTKDGRILSVQIQERRIVYRGSPAVLSSAYELTRLHEAEDRLIHNQALLNLAQQLARVGNFSHVRRSGERIWSEELYRILGVEPATSVLIDGLWSYAHPEDIDRVRTAVLRSRSEHQPYSIDYKIVRADGEIRHVHEQGQCEYDETGEWSFSFGTLQDITERKKAEAEILNLAYHDPLTKALNRAGLLAHISEVLSRSPRHSVTGLLFLDVDRFKIINDTLGHRTGDDVLVAIADRLSARLRDGEVLARLGGDEFAVVIPWADSLGSVTTRSEKLLETFILPIIIGGNSHAISASAGVSVYPSDACGGDELLRNADVAMYAAKAQGGKRYQFYTGALQEEAARRFNLEQGLRGALRRDEFNMHYQPIVRADNSAVESVESLIRWNNAPFGIPPEEFIGFAEESGLIGEVGDWVFETTFRQAGLWHANGMRFRIWINVSAAQLRGELPGKLCDLLRRHALSSDAVGLELTESSFINGSDATLKILREIKSLGIPLALDDFGVKYSSLEYLQRLPIDTIKIDRAFVSGADASSFKQAVIASVVSIAHELGCSVSAEGIETEKELKTVAGLGCDTWQGYLFSRALPPGQITPGSVALGAP